MAREKTIKIKAVEYQVFYVILRKVFIEDCFKDNEKINPESNQIWVQTDWVTGKSYSARLLAGTPIDNPEYFQRKLSSFDPKDVIAAPINVHAFKNGLEYIGLKPINLPDYEKMHLDDKVKLLYKRFREKYVAEIEIEKKRKEENDDVIYSASNQLQQINKISPSNLELSEATATVYTFYDNLNIGNYKEAWDVLSPIKQNEDPWLGDFEKFRIEYKNTNRRRNILVLQTNQPRPNIVECKVFYDDEIDVHTSKELHLLDILTVNDIDVFKDQIRNIEKAFEDEGLQGFGNIEIHKLFDPNASAYISYKTNLPPDKFKKIFPVKKSMTVRRIQECTCMYVRDSWLVNEIKSFESYVHKIILNSNK